MRMRHRAFLYAFLYIAPPRFAVRDAIILSRVTDVMDVKRAALIAFALSASIAIAGCTSASPDCTCAVERNGERATLACGQTACVGGVTLSCRAKDAVDQAGACTSPPPQNDPDAGGGVEPPPDRSCDDLASFCGSSCTRPATIAADCQSTASAGDPQACASWQTANGALCKP